MRKLILSVALLLVGAVALSACGSDGGSEATASGGGSKGKTIYINQFAKGIRAFTRRSEGIKDFARGCMRTYLILKEKAERFNQDAEIQALLQEIRADDGSLSWLSGGYSADKAQRLKEQTFDRVALGQRDLRYERLDQLTIELLLGVR